MRNLFISALALLLASVAAPAQQYIISTIAGRGQPLYYASALTAAISPLGVAVDTVGAVYFTSNNAVYRLDLNGALTRLAGGYAAGCAGDGGLAINAQLSAPQGIAVDAAGSVYIADVGNNRIRKVSPDGVITTPVGNTNPDCGPGGVPNAFAAFERLTGVAVDSAGSIYIADWSNGSVTKVSAGIVTTLIDNVVYLTGVAVDTAFSVYITGYGVKKINPNGTAGPVVASDIQTTSVAVDAAGNFYFADEQGDGTPTSSHHGRRGQQSGRRGFGLSARRSDRYGRQFVHRRLE